MQTVRNEPRFIKTDDYSSTFDHLLPQVIEHHPDHRPTTMTPSIPLRKLGADGPDVPALGYGMMGLSQPVYGSVSSEEDKFAMLDRAYELGARHWDSSE